MAGPPDHNATTTPPEAGPSPRRGLYGGSAEHRRAVHPERMAAGPHVLADPDAVAAWLAQPGPIEVEVGFGKGRFLVERTRALLDGARMLGFEVQARFCRATDAALTRAGLTNAALVQGDARPLIAALVPPGRLDAVHVGFPDPWWKKRHHRRRVFTPQFIDVLFGALRPGGSVTLRTDVGEYADDVVARFLEDGRFEHVLIGPDELPATDRELRCVEFGLHVHRHRFIRKHEGSDRP